MAVDDFEVVDSSSPSPAPSIPTPDPQPVAVEATEDADATAAVSEPSEPQKPAKPNSIQARIDKAVAAQREAERRAEAVEARLRELEARQSSAAAPREPQKPVEPQYTRPRPTEDEIGTKYQSYPEFVEALTDWKLEQREAQAAVMAQRRAMAERHQQHATKFVEQIAKAEQTDPQFWSKVDPAVANLRPSSALEPGERRTVFNAIADIIFDSDYATELMARLRASDLQRLSTLPPERLFREMGRLEAAVMRTEAASSGPAPKTPVISQAPPPIKPVGTTATTGEVDPLSDDLDVDEHIRVMNARDKRGRFTSSR